MNNRNTIKVGIFYDGNFFHTNSSYYKNIHNIRNWISIKGFHDFIKDKIASFESTDKKLVQIVTAHYFRGRLPAKDAYNEDKLYSERVLEDILLSEDVVTHSLLVRKCPGGRKEKGVDVWLALEAYEQVIHKKLDYLVLIAGDGDFVPLVKKVQSMGTKVFLIGWNFEYIDENGEQKKQSTSPELISSSIYFLEMSEIIEDGLAINDEQVLKLFFDISEEDIDMTSRLYSGKISSVKPGGYGFIESEQLRTRDIFFHFSNIKNISQFNPEELLGKEVKFQVEEGQKGHKYHAYSVYLLKQKTEKKKNYS